MPLKQLSAFVAVALATNAAAAGQTSPDPVAVEADRIIKTVWDAHLRHCGTSAFELLDARVILELDRPQFHLAPTHLQPAAKQNGYEYQTTAIASARRWRWAPLAGTRALKWSPWQDGQTLSVRFDQFGAARGQTTVNDAVLQFDLVRKNGKWTANHPLSPLNSDFRGFDPTTSAPASGIPPCAQLTREGGGGAG